MIDVPIQERVRIPVPAGSLAGELAYPCGDTRFSAVLVNPHPHMGGRTGNRLMVCVREALVADGGAVLTFDYSGVGESTGSPVDVAGSMSRFWETGTAPEDPRLVDDAAAAAIWMKKSVGLPLTLIGYSFGAYAAYRVAPGSASGLVMVSPTLRQHGFLSTAGMCPAAVVIYGDRDFTATPDDVRAWAACHSPVIPLTMIEGADHFYRGREPAVADACRRFIVSTEGLVRS